MTVSSRETSAGARAVLTGANILGAAGAAFLVFGPISVATPVQIALPGLLSFNHGVEYIVRRSIVNHPV